MKHQPRNSVFGSKISSPGKEHVGDETVRAAFLYEQLEWVLEQREGVDEFGEGIGVSDEVNALEAFGEADVGGRELDGSEVDLGLEILGNSLCCFGEHGCVERGGDYSCLDAAGGEESGHVEGWEHVALSHQWEEKDVKLTSFSHIVLENRDRE